MSLAPAQLLRARACRFVSCSRSPASPRSRGLYLVVARQGMDTSDADDGWHAWHGDAVRRTLGLRHVVGDDAGDDAAEPAPMIMIFAALQRREAGPRRTLCADSDVRRGLPDGVGRVLSCGGRAQMGITARKFVAVSDAGAGHATASVAPCCSRRGSINSRLSNTPASATAARRSPLC